MSFNIERVKQYTEANKSRGGFNIDRAISYGTPMQTVAQPTDFNQTLADIAVRRTDEQSVRLPFSPKKAELGGGAPTRFAANLILRSIEDLVVGGAKVTAQARNKEISLPFAITHEPTLDGGAPVTQQRFKPMSESALNRINELDTTRPDKSFLNLLQGASEEVFLPLLNAVDIVGLSSLATRLARKATFSKEALTAFKTLNMGLLSDTSEAGIRQHFVNQVAENISKLEKGKIQPQAFVKKMDDIGGAIDKLSNSKTTRFGKVGEKINKLATQLEMERSLSRAVDNKKFKMAEEVSRRTVREAERTKLPVKSVSDGSKVEMTTPEIKYTPDAELPTIDYGQPAPKSKVPSIDIDEPLKNVNVTTKELIKQLPDKERLPVISNVRRYYGKGFNYPVAEEKAYADYLRGQSKKLAEVVPIETGNIKNPLAKSFAENINTTVKNKQVKIKKETTDFEARSKPATPEETPAKTKVDTPESTPAKPEAKVTTTPAKSVKPEKGVSKIAKRINENLPEGSKVDELYDVIQIKDKLDEAASAIEKDVTKATKKALSKNTSVSDSVATLMELAEMAKNSGDTATQMALLSKMRVIGTDSAQGLNMFKAYGFSNPETKFMKDVVESRLGKISISADDISRAGSRNQAINKKVYEPIRKDINKKVGEVVKLEDAQKLFNDLIC